MNTPVECLRCHVPMEAGFLPDGTHAGFQQTKWTAGRPQPSFWTGIKLKRDKLLPVTTYRCPRCGYLESFATGEADTGA